MKLGPYELNQIYTGDARELSQAIPDSSCDLIFTDPVYSNIEDYEWLAKTAARVLKPDSACLVWCKVNYMAESENIFKKFLDFRWWIALVVYGGGAKLFSRNMLTNQA